MSLSVRRSGTRLFWLVCRNGRVFPLENVAVKDSATVTGGKAGGKVFCVAIFLSTFGIQGQLPYEYRILHDDRRQSILPSPVK